MTPAFGFSIGDFIGAIELCRKVAKALKPIGGASSSFQDLALELHSLENALQRLATLEPTESNINHVNAIRCMALACKFPLQQFLDKIDPYEAYLGSYAEHSLRATGKKAKWAVLVDEEVNKLRAVVSAKVISINLLLALHASEALSRLEQKSKTRQEELLLQLEDQKQSTQRVADETSRVREDIRNYNIQASHEDHDFKKGLHSRLDALDRQTMEVTRKIAILSVDAASNNRSLISMRRLGAQLMDFIRSFPTEIRDLLQKIIQGNLQIFHTLLAIQNSISASPSLLNSSNIRFEDALGVVRSLPFQWFRYWEPFHGLLQSQFTDTPGKSKVLNGEFCLVPARRSGTTITKEQWTRVVQPGADIIMLMVMTHVSWNGFECPRPTCAGRPSIEASITQIVICPACGLRYSTSVADVTEVNILHDQVVIQDQLQVDEELFGSRATPLETNIEDVEMKEAPVFADGTKTQDEDRPHHFEAPQAPTPLLDWLYQVVPAREPHRSSIHAQNADDRKISEHQLEKEEIEYFKNVRVNPTVTDADALPLASDPREPDLEFGARVYYRNMTDRYPEMARYLAIRLAEANWARTKRLGAAKFPTFVTSATVAGSVSADSSYMSVDNIQDSDAKTGGKHTCPICHQGFRRKRGLLRHRKRHICSATANFKCPDCVLDFRSQELCESHWHLEHSNIAYSHPKCDQSAGPAHRLRTHLQDHHLNTNFAPAQDGVPRLSSSVELDCGIDDYMQKRTSIDEHVHESEQNSHKRRKITFLGERRPNHGWRAMSYPLDSPQVHQTNAEYWTGSAQPARPSSRVSSRNSSLHGYQIFDPQDQNMTPATIPRRGSVQSMHSRGSCDRFSMPRPQPPLPIYMSSNLPPPPVALGTVTSFDCDICGRTLKIRKKRHWKRHVMQDLRPYMCHIEDCSAHHETFSRRRDLLQHYRKHLDGTQDSCISSLRGSWYECTLCNGKFLDPVTVRFHQTEHHWSTDFSMTSHLYGETIVVDPSTSPCISASPRKLRCDHISTSELPPTEMNYSFNVGCNVSGQMAICGRVALQAWEDGYFDSRYVRIIGPTCPICNGILAPGERLLLRHLGRHLEEIAFAVVRKPYEEWNFYQDTSSEMTTFSKEAPDTSRLPLSPGSPYNVGLFRLLQRNVNRYQDLSELSPELSEPPDLYSSLLDEIETPPEADMNPSDPDLVPYNQELRFHGDLYTPLWVRGHGNKREGWCGICKPGRWLVLKNSAYWYDKSFSHGVSAATGLPVQEPKEMRRTEGNLDVWEGLCGSCGDWIAIVSSKKKGTTWFRHAYKCHAIPKKDAPKRRNCTHASSTAQKHSIPLKEGIQSLP